MLSSLLARGRASGLLTARGMALGRNVLQRCSVVPTQAPRAYTPGVRSVGALLARHSNIACTGRRMPLLCERALFGQPLPSFGTPQCHFSAYLLTFKHCATLHLVLRQSALESSNPNLSVHEQRREEREELERF